MEIDKKQHHVRAVHEQLRSNHIDTLEILQSTQQENDQLKLSLQHLQEKVDSMTNLYNSSDTTTSNTTTAPSTEQTEMIQLLQKNRDLIEQITVLKDQIKQYQLQEQKRILAQQKAGGTSIEELSTIIHKMKQKEYHDLMKIKELEKTNIQTEQTMEQMKEQYEEQLKENKQHFMLFQNQLFAFQQQYQEMKNDLLVKTQEHAELILQKDTWQQNLQSYGQYQSIITRQEKEMNQKNEEIHHCYHQIEQYERMLEDKDAIIDQLQQELHRISASFSEHHDPERLRTTLPMVLQFADSNDSSVMEVVPSIQMDAPQVIIPSPRRSPLPQSGKEKIPEEESQPIVVSESVTKEVSESPSKGNIRFQEFMNLKLENRELKMRLAELTSHLGGLSVEHGNNYQYQIQSFFPSHANQYNPHNNSSSNNNNNQPSQLSKSGKHNSSNNNRNNNQPNSTVTSNANVNVMIPAIGFSASVANSSVGSPATAIGASGSSGKYNGKVGRSSFDSGIPTNHSNHIVPILSKSHTASLLGLTTGSTKERDLATSASNGVIRASVTNRPRSSSIKFPKVNK